MKIFFKVILIIFGGSIHAQDHLVFQNVRFFDGNQVFESVNVDIFNGRIRSINTEAISITDSSVIVEADGKTMLPGLINSHVHAWDKSQLKQAMNVGVFAVLDMHSPEEYTSHLRTLEKKDGYAQFYSAGYAATIEGGHGTQFGYSVPIISDTYTPSVFVKDRKKAKSDYIKIIYEPARPTLSKNQVSEVINEAHNQELLAVAHISHLESALELTDFGIDAFVHVWDDVVITSNEAKKIAIDELFVIPTLTVHEKAQQYYKENKIAGKMLPMDSIIENVRILHQNQVPILAGTDPPNLGINHSSSLFRELFLLVKAGMSPVEVLQSATLNPATYFRLKNLGVLKEGMEASFILVDGDPTKRIEDIENPKSIWVEGVKIY